MYVTITSLVYYPSSNRCTLLGMPFPQCSCAFHHKTYTELLLHSSCCASYGLVTYTALFSSTLFNFYCCTFCSITTCTALSPFISLFFFFHNRHSLYLCSLSSHLKHSTTTITSCLLIILLFTSHYFTLLLNTSNLFWGIIVLFSLFLLSLQLWARCPNPLQFLHNFPLLSSSSSLSLARVHFSLSKLLINELYYCRDIVLCLYNSMEVMLVLAYLCYIC